MAIKPDTVNDGSKAYAEGAGLWHPIGDNKRLPVSVHEMNYNLEKANVIPLRDQKIADLESMQGGRLKSLVGDRSNIDNYLTSVEGVDFETPVLTEGGMGFMRRKDAVWAGDEGRITGLLNDVNDYRNRGADVYGSFTPLGHGTMDYNVMMADSIYEQIHRGDISGAAIDRFDDIMRAKRPDWMGVHHPDQRAKLDTNGALRHAFMDTVQLDEMKKAGFPDLAPTRRALTENSLLDTPLFQGGQSIVELDGTKISEPLHKTYNTAIGGEYIGGIPEGVPSQIMYPDYYKQRRLEGKPVSGDPWSFLLNQPSQDMNQEWIDGVMNYLYRRQD